MSKTNDALEIMRRLFDHGEETQQILEEEWVRTLGAQAIYDARNAAGLTQRELAQRACVEETVIAQLEDADYNDHTIIVLRQVAAALGQRLEMRFVSSRTEDASSASQSEQNEAQLGARMDALEVQLQQMDEDLRQLKTASTASAAEALTR